MKNRLLYLGILAIFLVGALAGAFLYFRTPAQPSFEGRLLDQWLVDLKSLNPATRDKARGALREMGPQAVSWLCKDLGRNDSFPRAKSIEMLKRIPSLRPRLISQSERHGRSISALRQLKPHSKEVIAALSTHLLTTNTGIHALNALMDVGSTKTLGPEMVEPLSIALRSVDIRVRRTAAAELKWLPPNNPQAIATLQRVLNDPDKSIHLTAALSLIKLSTNASVLVPTYVKLFDDHPGFERIAIEGVIKLEAQTREAVPMLVRAAKGENIELRRLAIYGLGRIHSDGEHVIPLLVGFLDDSDNLVVRNAAYALGSFGREATNAIPAILKLKESKDGIIRNASDYVMKNMLSSAQLERRD